MDAAKVDIGDRDADQPERVLGFARNRASKRLQLINDDMAAQSAALSRPHPFHVLAARGSTRSSRSRS